MATVLTDKRGERFVDTVTIGGKNRLCVDASLTVDDISIGAVEIKDGDSDIRLDVEVCGDYNAILTQDCVDFQKTKINIFGQSLITKGSTLTVATHTVTAGKTFHFTGLTYGGSAMGEFDVELDGATTFLLRNTGSSLTQKQSFSEPPEVGAGKVINIKVENMFNKDGIFDVTIEGFEI